jgi:small subunit ribosomal protein S16
LRQVLGQFKIVGFASVIPEFNMVVVRLARGGSKGRPFFNIVAADKQCRRDGRFIERLGFYNPMLTEESAGLTVSMDRITHWQSKGAQLSPCVARLVKTYAKRQAGQAA